MSGGPISTPGNSGVTGSGTTDSSGLPIFGAGTPVTQNDPTTIWYQDLPTDLQGIKIWYDIRPAVHHETLPEYGSVYNEQVPGGVPVPMSPSAQQRVTIKGENKQHELAPVDILKQVNAMSANDPSGFQSIQVLLSSGAWGTVHVNGVFDHDTESALVNAMERYQQLSHGAGVGMSFTQYLERFGSAALRMQNGGSGSGGSGVPQVALQDPATIRQYAQAAAQQALGRDLSEGQLDQFVQQFQSAQQAAQTSTGASATTPDLSSDAMAFVQQNDAGDYKQNQRQSYLDALVNLFGGTRPSQDVTSPVKG